MLGYFRQKVFGFLYSNDTKNLSIIAAISSGLYPMLYYYNSNFTLVNSWSQLFFFITSYIAFPVVIFTFIVFIIRRNKYLKKYIKYVIPALNYSTFTFLVIVSTYGFKNKILVLAIVLAFILGVFLFKFIRKIIVFQFLLSVFVLAKLIPDFYKSLKYSNDWMMQPDNIQDVVFKKRPNIYIIQPDGYANFSELKRGYYNFNNSEFESFLLKNDFKSYNNFRSNYNTTLSSNSSIFAMKHHYYSNTNSSKKELFNARDIIVGENPVISIFKKNNYKTFLLLEKPYLLINRPKVFYDTCNIDLKEISFLSRGFSFKKNIKQDLVSSINENRGTNNFYFIEKMTPGHVSANSTNSLGKIEERKAYIKGVKEVNTWLKDLIEVILKKDKKCMIVIVADHGGYVGFNSTSESRTKQIDSDLVNSIFTSTLSIKWPDESPEFDDKLKTSVNLFRILFSYLSDNKIYLEHLQEDKSFIPIEKKGSLGIYEYINEKGEVVFNKL